MKLQQIRLELSNHGVEQSIIGIDGQGHFDRTAIGLFAQRGCGFKGEMARTFWKKDKANQLHPGGQRGL